MEHLQSSKCPKEKDNNLTLREDKIPTQQHLLFNQLVLDEVFGYLKGSSNTTVLAKYRTTCKVWDAEIVKLLRKDTQINLTTILAPYPDGMGWTPSPGNSEIPYYYDVPYSEVRPFENVLVIVHSCDDLKNRKWNHWFRMMGSQVKGLCLSSPFTCYCQNRFLERILKKWCPNLESLELCNVKCIESLLLVSTFLQNLTPLICKSVKTLKISVDGNELHNLCSNINPYDTPTIYIRAKAFCMQMLTKDLMHIIYKYGFNSDNAVGFPEIINFSQDQFMRKKLPDLSETLSRDLRNTDGGIVGQLMKDINLEKLEIRNLTDEKSYNDYFATIFHLRSNKWRLSLKELELSKNLSKSIDILYVIAQVKFPLISIKLHGIHSHQDDGNITRILEYFANTLEHLEFSGLAVQQEVVEFRSALNLPPLPKLKTFIHENISACGLSADNLWRNAPNLEKVFLKGNSTTAWSADRLFRLFRAISSNAMKELRLLVPINGTQAETILDWFPNLLKMELVLKSFGVSAYGFFEKLEESKVGHLRIDILGLAYENMFENDKTVAFWKDSNIKGLKSLELNNMANLPFLLTPDSFSSVKLKFLKLINFRIYIHQKKELMSKLSHISAVELVNPVYLTRSETSLKKKTSGKFSTYD